MFSDNTSFTFERKINGKEKKAILLHNNALSNDTYVKDKTMHYHTCKLKENRKALLYQCNAISYV